MQLAKMAWPDVETYLAHTPGIMLPVGSTEQHGPMGMIGTDALCAEAVALAAAERCGCVVAPTLSYTPAPFNTSFPGTLSLSSETFRQMAAEALGLPVDAITGWCTSAIWWTGVCNPGR